MALMPAPPIPTTCTVRRSARIAERPGPATAHRYLRDRAGRALASTTRAPARGGVGRPSEAAARPMASRPAGSPSSRSSTAARVGAVAVGIGQQDRGPGPLEHPGIGRLVVARGAGQGNQHRGHPGHGQLGHGHGPGPAHHQVGGGVDLVHPLLVGHPHHAEAPVVAVAGGPARRTPSAHAVPVPSAHDVVDRPVVPVLPPRRPARRPPR